MMYSPVCVFKYTTNKAFYVKAVASAHGIKPGRSREIIHSHTTPNYPILNTETRVEDPPEAHPSAKRKWIGNSHPSMGINQKTVWGDFSQSPWLYTAPYPTSPTELSENWHVKGIEQFQHLH